MGTAKVMRHKVSCAVGWIIGEVARDEMENHWLGLMKNCWKQTFRMTLSLLVPEILQGRTVEKWKASQGTPIPKR